MVLNADYPRFLSSHYAAHPELQTASYAVQMAARDETLFGVADFYSKNFVAHGQNAREIHLNNPWLQSSWANQNGLSARPVAPPKVSTPGKISFKQRLKRKTRTALSPVLDRFRSYEINAEEERIFLAQVEDYQPDIILNQEMSYVRDRVLFKLKKPGRLIIGQIASTLPKSERFHAYDLVVSSLPNFVEWFRSRGVRSELNRLAFEPSVLRALGAAPARDVDVSFVGSLSIDHRARIALLEAVAANVDLKLWGNGIETLPASSPLHRCYQGEAWGRDMYEALRRSRITLNHHIDLSDGYANNMRLYEATGVGTLMLVDAKRNLGEIFLPGVEVETYQSAEECVAKVKGLLASEERRAQIAAAGQARTLLDHNYFNRTNEILGFAAGSHA